MKYIKTNAGNKFANEYALLSAENNCNKPNDHNFRKFYNKLAEFLIKKIQSLKNSYQVSQLLNSASIFT